MEEIKPIGYLLAKTQRVFKNQMIAEFKKQQVGLTFEQFVILHLLSLNCDIIQQDLANHLQKDKSIIVRQIDGLIEKKLVERLTHEEDKRKRNLVLTDAGTEKLKQMRVTAKEVTEKLLFGIEAGEVEIFRKVMNKINENGGYGEESSKCCAFN